MQSNPSLKLWILKDAVAQCFYYQDIMVALHFFQTIHFALIIKSQIPWEVRKKF